MFTRQEVLALCFIFFMINRQRLILLIGLYSHIIQLRRRRFRVRENGYTENVLRNYHNPSFKMHFRMERNTFEVLCEHIVPVMRGMECPFKKVLSFLWMVGNSETYRSVADRFGVSKGVLHNQVRQVTDALLKIADGVIKFPDGRGHQVTPGPFPGVVGYVDGTYIQLASVSRDKREGYTCRKGYPALHAQVTCDSNLKIIDFTIGFPGSAHDARVFRRSTLHDKLQSLPEHLHVLGDSAYPLETFCMTPYRNTGLLTPAQINYNFVHSSIRVNVERCIGLLKNKFRRLKYFDGRNLELICKVATACAVVHNMILDNETIDETEAVDAEDTQGVNVPRDDFVPQRRKKTAVDKRNGISTQLMG